MRDYMYCNNCFNTMAIIEHDGHKGHCITCHTPFIFHHFIFHHCQSGNCGLHGIPQQLWLPLVTPYISKACPLCGIAIKIGQQLETSSDQQTSSLGRGLVLLGLILGGAVLLDRAFGNSPRTFMPRST